MEPEVRRRFERIEAILEDISRRQAEAEERFEKHEARFDKSEARFDKSEARFEKNEARFDKLEARFEKRMRGFEKLAEIGMKEIAQMRRAQRQTDDRINALIESQQRTETSLQRLIDSLGKSPNGGRRSG
jgi:hypothetical protein